MQKNPVRFNGNSVPNKKKQQQQKMYKITHLLVTTQGTPMHSSESTFVHCFCNFVKAVHCVTAAAARIKCLLLANEVTAFPDYTVGCTEWII